MPNKNGLTLIELLVTISICGILLATSIPSFLATLEKQRLRDTANRFLKSLTVARNEAILRGIRVGVAHQNGAWGNGWSVFVDTNANGKPDQDELLILQEGPAHQDVSIKANMHVREYVSCIPDGRTLLTTNAFQAGTLFFCPTLKSIAGIKVVIARGGRASLQSVAPNSADCQI